MENPIEEYFDIIYNYNVLIEFAEPLMSNTRLFLNGKYPLDEFDKKLNSVISSIITSIDNDKRDVIISQLNEAKNEFVYLDIDGTSNIFQKNYYFQEAGPNPQREKLIIENFSNTSTLIKEYNSFSLLKYQSIIKLIDNLELNQKLNSNLKLRVKIPVSDLSLLFRLLDEEGQIEYKHKTEIYRFIASSFNTERQENISEASIKNKFLSPDSTALKNIDILLVNLRQQLKKIQ